VGRGAFYHKVKYKYAGGRSIRLTVKDTNGCWDTAYKKISVNGHPKAQLKIAGQSLCFRGNEYQFEDSSSISAKKINSYIWTFGKNANISSATGIGVHKIKYSDTGKSIIVLIVKDDNGCSDTTKKYIYTKSHPKAKLIQLNDSMCLRQNNFTFRDTSSAILNSKISQINWDFGGAKSPTSASGKGPHNVKYSNIGNYKIRLTVKDTNGCWDTTFASIKVLEHPQAKYISSSLTGCAGLTTFKFQNKSILGSKSINNIWWDLGDGVKITDTIVNTKFKESKKYSIKLNAKAKNGCDDTLIFDVVLDTIPNVKFANITGDTQCLNENEFQFSDSSSARKSQTLSKWKWEFGDGDTDIINTPITKHKYRNSGYYQVKLTRITKNGCSATVQTKVKVNESPKSEVIILKNLICAGDKNAELVGYASAGAQPYTWKWNNDPKLTLAKLSNATVGYHFVDVTDKNNCFSRADIYVKNPDSIRYKLEFRDVTCFDGSDGFSKISILSGGEAPFKYKWSEKRPVYFDTITNLKSGNYTITMTDNRGCSQIGQVYIQQPNKLGLSIDTIKQISCWNVSDATLKISVKGGITPYQYSLNQSNYQSSDQFNNLGRGKYFLKVRDKNNCLTFDSLQLFGPKSLTVNIVSDTLVCYRDSNAILKAAVIGGTPTYRYNWKKNGIIVSNNTQLQKQSSGKYEVILTDNNGCIASAIKSLNEPDPFRPLVDIPTALCYNADYIASVKPSLKNTWQTPRQTITVGSQLAFKRFGFKDAGWYKLKSTSLQGCEFVDSFYIKLNPRPTVNGDTACVNSSATMNVNGSYINQWLSPSGKTYNGSSLWIPKVQRTDSGDFLIYCQTSYGCLDTLKSRLMVIPTPKLGILINKQGFICEKEDIQLAATSNMKTKYHWKVPNGQSQFNDNISLPRISSKDHGIYWLIGENEYGCFDSVSKFIESKGNPTANLEMDQFGCDKSDVDPSAVFRDNSIGSTQRWLYREDTLINEFKEQSQVLKQNPGTYRYKLVVKNQYNCFDSTSFNFTIFPRPKLYMATAFTPNNDKLNNYYKPVGNNAIQFYNMKIYNRWGQKLFEWEGDMNNDQSVGSWDGRINGEMQQEGVYLVLIRAIPTCGAHLNEYHTFHMLR